MVGKFKAPTKAEKARMEAVKQMRCIACEIMRVQQPFPTEVDHDVSNGYRRLSGGHMATIPLDGWHHRGICIEGVNEAEMACAYGPSFALEKRKAVEWYGSKRDLLAIVDKRLEVAA